MKILLTIIFAVLAVICIVWYGICKHQYIEDEAPGLSALLLLIISVIGLFICGCIFLFGTNTTVSSKLTETIYIDSYDGLQNRKSFYIKKADKSILWTKVDGNFNYLRKINNNQSKEDTLPFDETTIIYEKNGIPRIEKYTDTSITGNSWVGQFADDEERYNLIIPKN